MDCWEGDENPPDFSQQGPEYEMWRQAQQYLRSIPCTCGYFSPRTATRCLKCEEALPPIPE